MFDIEHYGIILNNSDNENRREIATVSEDFELLKAYLAEQCLETPEETDGRSFHFKEDPLRSFLYHSCEASRSLHKGITLSTGVRRQSSTLKKEALYS